MSQIIFGTRQNLAATIYLPIKSERIDYWMPSESGITRFSIAANHTMCPYFTISSTLELRAEVERILDGGIPTIRHDHRIVHKSMRSWLQYLRYCPLCVTEDINVYGEAYWHRKHQLLGSYYCTKHQVRLVNSRISIKQATWGFYPASNEVQVDVTPVVADIFDKYKDKCLKIGQESEWLLENGLSIDWQENGCDKYLLLFRDRKMASIHGTRGYPTILSDAVNDYWGSEFLDALFAGIRTSPKWLSCIYINKSMMSRFLPLQHILLMCVAKGSVKDFVSSEVVENPFGNAPYICENPICVHYNDRSAICTEFRNTSIEVIGIFHCLTCGMKYKKVKGTRAKGRVMVQDYGHLWFSELIRCSHDKNISNFKTAEILKTSVTTIKKQKQKLGLGGDKQAKGIETKI